MLYLREWRQYRRLTLKQLQALTDIDFRILSKYETGFIDHPDTAKMAKLAAVLDGNLFVKPPEEPPGAEESVATAVPETCPYGR
jgi:transcriptional regulator with XRE-family HTH domain